LLCHRDLFPGFVSQIWTQIIDPTDYRRFEMDRADLSNLVAWSVVQQGYYNYKKRMPQALSHRLTSLEENATRFAHDQSSKSEYRVRKLLEAIDGITVQSKMIRHGFDQDIPFSVRGVRKSFVLEVDGALHAAPAQRLQDDASMSAHAAMGVTVVRVPSNATAEQVRAAIGRVVPAFTSPS
jgi:very-short-patch-repair endonuclease